MRVYFDYLMGILDARAVVNWHSRSVAKSVYAVADVELHVKWGPRLKQMGPWVKIFQKYLKKGPILKGLTLLDKTGFRPWTCTHYWAEFTQEDMCKILSGIKLIKTKLGNLFAE